MNRVFFAAAALLFFLSAPTLAEGIVVKDAYVRASTPASPTGAAFMVLMNESTTDDRLIAASTQAAERVELHRHAEDANGVMRMGEIEGGIALPAGGMLALARGGDHVMLMGLTEPLVQEEEITLILTFERAGDIVITVPVDHARRP